MGKGGFLGNYEFLDSPKHLEDKLFKACKDRFVSLVKTLND